MEDMNPKPARLSICIILVFLLISCGTPTNPSTHAQPNDSKDINVKNKPIYIIGPSNMENIILATDNKSLLFLKIDGRNGASAINSIALPEINDYSIDTKGNIWIATDAGITIVDSNGNIKKHITEEPFNKSIWAIRLNHNSILVSIFGKGVWSANISYEGDNIIMQNLKMVLPILTKKVEIQGASILLGTHGNGLMEIMSDASIEKYNNADDPTMDYVNDISFFNERVFIATYSGIYDFTNKKWHHYTFPDKPKSEFMYAVQPLDKYLTLAGGAAGLFAYCEETNVWEAIGTSDNVVYDIFIQDNIVYIASYNGLLIYSASDIKSIC